MDYSLEGRISSRNADLENDGGGGSVIWFIAKKHLLLYFINAQSDLPSKIGDMHGLPGGSLFSFICNRLQPFRRNNLGAVQRLPLGIRVSKSREISIITELQPN